MTAYSRTSQITPLGRWVLELHSVNRKMLDVSINLPHLFLRFDRNIRKWIANRIQRGQLTVRLYFTPDERNLSQLHLRILKELKDIWEHLAEELGYQPKEAVSLSFLAQQMQSFPVEESSQDEALLKTLQSLFDKALEELIKMKLQEGDLLVQDIKKRLKIISEGASTIAQRAPDVTLHYRKKLTQKMAELGALTSETEERILKEVLLFAERSDITEELIRLNAHLKQFHEKLQSDEKSIGKTLDFLIQEMNREITTICAKSVDVAMSSTAVSLKSELEKIREQVQNIE